MKLPMLAQLDEAPGSKMCHVRRLCSPVLVESDLLCATGSVAVAGTRASFYWLCRAEWVGPGTIPRLSSTVMIRSAATSYKT